MTCSFGQTVTYNEFLQDGVGGVDGLNGTYGLAISPDNRFLYTSSSTDDAVAVFSRNTSTGDIAFVEVHKDHDQVGGTIVGLRDGKRCTVSPDGSHLYVCVSSDDGIVVFSRDSLLGTLTLVEFVQDGIGGVDGLNGSHECVVSPDNKHVYAVGYVDDAIAVFTRNATTGVLTFVEMQKDGVGGVDGLNNARGITVSPDGAHIYAAGATDDAVAVFSRNSTTGALTYVEMHKDGISGVDGLNGAYGIHVSADDDDVYVASYNDDALAHFSRNSATGALTFVETFKDDSQTGGTIPNLNAARMVTGTDDGSQVLVVASSDHAVTVFDRNTTTGNLTIDETHVDGVGGVDGLNGVRFIALTSDDNSMYTVSTGDDGMSGFNFASLLPIELMSFEVKDIESHIMMSWTTLSEINNDYFTVERSWDGVDFETVRVEQGAGNSNEPIQYQLEDQHPGYKRAYYRLRQTDFDGTSTVSDMVVMEHATDHTTNTEVFPTVVDRFVQVAGNELDLRTIQFHDVLGHDVSNQVTLVLHSREVITYDLSQLTGGFYFVNTMSTTFRLYKK